MPGRDLHLLRGAALAAGEIARRHFRNAHQVWDKGAGQGPVTEADLEIDRMLRERLLSARPGYGWMSEESEDDAARLDNERLFIVDPIDGTRAFTEGHTTWSHSLAVVAAGVPVAAVIYLPLLDKLYTAEAGRGAALNDRAIVASPRESLGGADILATHPTLDAKHWIDGAPAVKRHFRSSLAYRLALVGEGRFDAMLTLRETWEWDIAAGHLIATEAGARITDRHGDALGFNTASRLANGVVCAPPGIHAGILSRLAP